MSLTPIGPGPLLLQTDGFLRKGLRSSPVIARVMAFVLIPLGIMLLTGFSMFTHPALFVLFLCILAVVATYAAYEWISWFGDVYVLTNQRIVDVEQDGFFHRKFAEAGIDNLEDVSYDVHGVWETLFNFGTIVAQTAGSIPNISLDQVPNPGAVARELLQSQEKYREEHDDHPDGPVTADQLIELLAKHGKNLDKLAELEKEEKKNAAKERTKENLEKINQTVKEERRFRRKKKAEKAE